MNEEKYLKISEAAKKLGKSEQTIRRWDSSGKLKAFRDPDSNYRLYTNSQLRLFQNDKSLDDNPNYIEPYQSYSVLELFAGAGGLAIGLEKAGLNCLALNELDKWAASTLKENRPNWNVIHKDIKEVDFKPFKDVDIITGGFPCQAFSYAGKKLGFKDARGTLFYEFARAVKETKPSICIAENVKGLYRHDKGRTLNGMINILQEIGYNVVKPKVLKAIHFNVPQKRERLFLVGVRKDINIEYKYPIPVEKVYKLKDALKKGNLFKNDVPNSEGYSYSEYKKGILDKVPQGGYWRDLPVNLQKEYMKKSYYLGGGKTGMARRISWDEPCLTLTCNPAQKQTERCHPDETRPFTVREYARIQTFPDHWEFSGSIAQQYKQIGNAVPVNLAKEIGYSIISFMNKYVDSKN